jgi:hypothetical protein
LSIEMVKNSIAGARSQVSENGGVDGAALAADEPAGSMQ